MSSNFWFWVFLLVGLGVVEEVTRGGKKKQKRRAQFADDDAAQDEWENE